MAVGLQVSGHVGRECVGECMRGGVAVGCAGKDGCVSAGRQARWRGCRW